MSGDIPPLIPDTPPPMTKLDWEDDEDFMDYPHLALELPSESSLSPDSGWNPIDELPLPYDSVVIDKPVDHIDSNSHNSSDWPSISVKNDQSMKPSISESESNLQPKNLIICKTKENIEKLTCNCDSVNGSGCEMKIEQNEFFDNVIDSYKRVNNDNMSVTTIQPICDKESTKNNIASQYSPIIELELNNMELIESNEVVQSDSTLNPENPSSKEILVTSILESIKINELTEQTICVQNETLENIENNVNDTDTKINSSNNVYKNVGSNISINSNNNIIKDVEEKYTDFCDFENTVPSSLNVSLPNRTSQEINPIKIYSEVIVKNLQHVDQVSDTQFKNGFCDISPNTLNSNKGEVEKCIDSINLNCSTFQNKKNDENNMEDDLDSEFNDFCDFHVFSTTANEKQLTPVENIDDFCDFERNTQVFGSKLELKQFNSEEVKFLNNNDNAKDNLKLKSDSKSDKNNCKDDDVDDSNFCDFESGYSMSGIPTSHQFLDPKQKDKQVCSELQIKFDYKQFCEDSFQGDYDLSEEVDLQNLDNELNDSQVWQNLKDVESSPALNYSWSKSESNSFFLSSLSIDSRNILYGASWNPKVPRFAANLSNNPLEPLKACKNDAIETKISQSFSNNHLPETVPDPEFDWKSSGLINPLDCNHTSLLDLELLDTLAPCCTNTLPPQTWKTSEIVNEESTEETPIKSGLKNVELFNKILCTPLPPLPDNQLEETIESLSSVTTTSLEAQMILDNLPDFEVLQKPYIMILEKGSHKFFLN